MVQPLSPERNDSQNLSSEAETLLTAVNDEAREENETKFKMGKRRSKRASKIPDTRPRIQKAIEVMRAESNAAFYEDLVNTAGKNADLPVPFPSGPSGISKNAQPIARKSTKTPSDYLPN